MRSLLNTSNAAYYGSTRRTELVRHLITGEDEDGIAGVFSVLTEAVASEMDRSADRALPSGLLRDYATRLRGTPLSMANAWNHHFLQVRDCTFLKPLTQETMMTQYTASSFEKLQEIKIQRELMDASHQVVYKRLSTAPPRNDRTPVNVSLPYRMQALVREGATSLNLYWLFSSI